MVTAGSYFSDRDCWGLSHNDFHRVAMQIPENIDVALNTTNNNDPLVLKAGSMFYVWGSSGITISANSSGNASYVAGSTYSYFKPYAVYTSTDFSPVWTSTAITSTGGNGTYYMVAKTGSDTKGQVNIDYLMSSVFTPSYSNLMGGWYGTTAGSTEYRTIARFIMTSGVISRACVFLSRITDPGYISNIDVFSTGTNIYLSKFQCDLGDGKAVKYLQECNLTAIAGLTASTWYAVAVNQNDGVIYNSSMAGTYSNWTITGNRLNAYSIFDENYNFMRALTGTTYHRVIDIYNVSSGSTDIPYNFAIKTAPNTNIYAISTSTTAMPNAVYVSPEMTRIEYDLNSQLSTATTFLTVNGKLPETQIYTGNWLTAPTSYLGSNTAFIFYAEKKPGTPKNSKVFSRYTHSAASTTIFINYTLKAEHQVTKSDIVEIYLYPGSTGGNVSNGSSTYSWIQVRGV